MPDIEHWLWEIGEAGQRLAELRALEGAAGNISLFLPHATPGLDGLLRRRLPRANDYQLPNGVRLPNGVLLITGTGRRLRDAARAPETVLCAINLHSGRAWLHRDPRHGIEPTSEIDSHAGIHAVVLGAGPSLHAIVHAQPPQLTWLSHIPEYQDFARLNRQLLRWQPETIVTFPEGIGVLPFETPGTPAQGAATSDAAARHKLLIWAKHGVVARSAKGPLAATDLVEYVEAVAGYEVHDLLAGRPADGLTLEELRSVARRFNTAADVLNMLPEALLEAATSPRGNRH